MIYKYRRLLNTCQVSKPSSFLFFWNREAGYGRTATKLRFSNETYRQPGSQSDSQQLPSSVLDGSQYLYATKMVGVTSSLIIRSSIWMLNRMMELNPRSIRVHRQLAASYSMILLRSMIAPFDCIPRPFRFKSWSMKATMFFTDISMPAPKARWASVHYA